MNRELNLVRLIKKQKQSDSLLKALTTKSQRRYAAWQSRGVIKLTEGNRLETSSSGLGSTPSENDYDPWFISKIIDPVRQDYTALNLLLLKRIWAEPRIKPSKNKEKVDPNNNPDAIPVSLEDIIAMRKKAFDEVLAVQMKAIEEDEKLERDRKEYLALLKEEYAEE